MSKYGNEINAFPYFSKIYKTSLVKGKEVLDYNSSFGG